jgi:hypothetical protein
MSFLASLLSFFFDVCSLFWLPFLKPLEHEPPPQRRREAPSDRMLQLDVSPKRDLSDRHPDGIVSATIFPARTIGTKEDFVTDSSFLSQLEQRTQQVKITLANLEAEKVRIEGLIAQLQPLVPHYDALLSAERAISEAQIALDTAEATAAPQPQHNPWDQPQEQPHANW